MQSTPPPPLHPFDQSLTLTNAETREHGKILTGAAPKPYWNMVGPFGGMTAAILLAAVLKQPDHLGEPLVLTVNFCAPVQDCDYQLHTRRIRKNRSTEHWHVEMRQQVSIDNTIDKTTNNTDHGDDGSRDSEDDQYDTICVAQATVVMGVRRDDWSLQVMKPPSARPPEECTPRPPRSGIAWFDRFDMRYVHNPLKDKPADADALTWVADKPLRCLDYLSLTNRCDALFPAIFAHRQKIDPIATVSFNVYYHTGIEELTRVGESHTLGVSRTNVHHHGFADSEAWMWSKDRLIATTQQLMWYRTG